MQYEYTKTNRLEQPHNYQFAPYGNDLLVAYLTDRQQIRKSLDQIVPSENSLRHCARTHTAQRAISGNMTVLLRLVKKFEVTKKLYAEYHEVTWKIVNWDYRDPSTYLCLSYACLRKFKEEQALPLLNAALKLNDLLSSIESTITKPDDRIALRMVLDLEHAIIFNIFSKKGISI